MNDDMALDGMAPKGRCQGVGAGAGETEAGREMTCLFLIMLCITHVCYVKRRGLGNWE